MGLVFGLRIGNFGMLTVGIPIGMAIGIGVGSSMDKKAFVEGSQLDFELNSHAVPACYGKPSRYEPFCIRWGDVL